MRVRPSRLMASRYKASATGAVAKQGAGAGLDPEGPTRCAGPCPLRERLERRGGGLRLAAADGRLDQLDQRPAEQAQIVMLACPSGGGEGAVAAAETVVQHCRRVLGQGDRSSLAPGGRIADAGVDQFQCIGLPPSPGGKHQRYVTEGRGSSCLGDHVRLVDQRRRGGEPSAMDVHARVVGERDGQDVQRQPRGPAGPGGWPAHPISRRATDPARRGTPATASGCRPHCGNRPGRKCPALA